MRLIDADQFLVFGYNDIPDANFADGVSYVLDKIDEAPTVKSVEVVRCRDCKYNPITEDFCEWEGCPCPMWDDGIEGCFGSWNGEDDGFCHKGERKENSVFLDIKTGLEQAIEYEKNK